MRGLGPSTRTGLLFLLMLISLTLAISAVMPFGKHGSLAARFPPEIAFGSFLLFSTLALSCWALFLYRNWRRMGLFPEGKPRTGGFLSWGKCALRWYVLVYFSLFVLGIAGFYAVALWYIGIGILRTFLWGNS